MPPKKIIIKLAKIAMGATIRWKRSRRQEVRDNEQKQETEIEEGIKYCSRLLPCTRCHEPHETRWVQLRVNLDIVIFAWPAESMKDVRTTYDGANSYGINA